MDRLWYTSTHHQACDAAENHDLVSQFEGIGNIWSLYRTQVFDAFGCAATATFGEDDRSRFCAVHLIPNTSQATHARLLFRVVARY